MKNNWVKKGCIFKVDGTFSWNKTHSQVPVVDLISEDTIRIYYATRDAFGKSSTSYIEVDANNPQQVKKVHDRPILEFGDPGTFDDSGIMPTCVINKGKEKYLYYIGWTTRGTVPFSNAIGVASSRDGGRLFDKVFQGPVIGQGPKEPFFTGTCDVIKIKDKFVAYYLSCTGWQELNNKMEPYYHLKIAVSDDGLDWKITGRVAIDLRANEAGIASATVIQDSERYCMWFSVRGEDDYRENPENSYKIGYAESTDGFLWVRKDSNILPLSKEGWDNNMIAYPNVVIANNKLYMFYNGNGFGQTGLGYAELKR